MNRSFPPIALALSFLLLAACENAPWREEVGLPPSPPAYNLMTTQAEPGETVQSQPGDTVYSVARRYKVSMRDVIALNHLQAPFQIAPGTQLVLPAKEIMLAPKKREPEPIIVAGKDKDMAPAPEAAPITPVEIQAQGETTYHQVAPPDENAPPPPVRYAPGEQQAMRSLATQSAQTQASPPTNAPEPLFTPAQPQEKVASAVAPLPPPQPLHAATPLVKPPLTTKKGGAVNSITPGRFIWPVHGSVVSDFGPKEGGTRNDGVNIAAPRGTPVAAADGGMVAYAGSDIPGYGNVVLIRHPDGFMTTYAHLERIFVAKDTVVAKGDVLGTVGTTGGLVTPQLHFEIRHGAEAFDPRKYLSRF